MISFLQVTKEYPNGTRALDDINFNVDQGEFVFIVGASGAGKSTLLKLLIREELPSQGRVLVDEDDVTKLPASKIPVLRRKIGIVFQDYKLLPRKTIFDNVAFALEVAGVDENEIKREVSKILKQMGLDHVANLFPGQVSGGEAQRVAIARAAILKPDIILADEPTGNLDPHSSWNIMELLQDLNDNGTTVIMATHNADFVKSLPHRLIEIDHGRITRDEIAKKHKQHRWCGKSN